MERNKLILFLAIYSLVGLLILLVLGISYINQQEIYSNPENHSCEYWNHTTLFETQHGNGTLFTCLGGVYVWTGYVRDDPMQKGNGMTLEDNLSVFTT